MIKFIARKKIWLGVSAVLVIFSIFSIFYLGFNWGVDFIGGSLAELKFKKEDVDTNQIRDSLSGLDLGNLSVQPTAAGNFLLRFKHIDEEGHKQIINLLQEKIGETEEMRFETVGPTIGKELKKKAWYAIILTSLGIVLYLAWAFRKASYLISSWKFGICALLALFHDIIIISGVFSLLGRYGVAVDSFFVTALLTVLGFSVHDTIVIFDRIRENLSSAEKDDSFAAIINESINQTIVRSLNTSLTTLLVLLAILFFGGETIYYFTLALVLGVIVGTYSSIFVAAPLLVLLERRSK